MARILLLEDEALIAIMVSDWLAELGHETIGPVGSAAAALPLIESMRPEAALLDVLVADGNSRPAAEALRARAIPFAFLSGAIAGEAIPFGNVPVLAKPFDFEALRAIVARLLASDAPASA